MTPNKKATESRAENALSINRLGGEKSPYLLQHAHNPVDWYPWGEEAFAKARGKQTDFSLDRLFDLPLVPCHGARIVREATHAEIINRDFVNIKVDREERPDVDRVYMTFVQATTGGGGWPMSVWLTPDLEPFVGGTYFPPEDRYGQPGFCESSAADRGSWKENHAKIAEQGAKILHALRDAGNIASGKNDAIGSDVLDAAL